MKQNKFLSVLTKFLQSFLQSKRPYENKYKRVFEHLNPFFVASVTQKTGIENILNHTTHLTIPQRAYLLATTYHETAFTMQPIMERGNGDGPDPDPWDDYLQKYDTGRLAKALGNTPEADGDGVRYAGRGYVQITGLYNYKRASKELGIDLVKNPELALHPDVAVKLLVTGCMDGWYTGRKLSSYINDHKKDYYNARRVVNGLNRASEIAAYAEKFEKALTLGL